MGRKRNPHNDLVRQEVIDTLALRRVRWLNWLLSAKGLPSKERIREIAADSKLQTLTKLYNEAGGKTTHIEF